MFNNNQPKLFSDAIHYLMPLYELPYESVLTDTIVVGYYKTYEYDSYHHREDEVDVTVAYPRTWFESDSWFEEYKAVFNSLTAKEEAEKENNRKQKDTKEKELFLKLKQKFEPQTSEKL